MKALRMRAKEASRQPSCGQLQRRSNQGCLNEKLVPNTKEIREWFRFWLKCIWDDYIEPPSVFWLRSDSMQSCAGWWTASLLERLWWDDTVWRRVSAVGACKTRDVGERKNACREWVGSSQKISQLDSQPGQLGLTGICLRKFHNSASLC